CDHCSGIDCGQDDPDRYLEQKMQDEERHDKEIRQDERDKLYKRLKALVTEYDMQYHEESAVRLSDIDYLFAELKEDPEKEAAPVGDAE
ncbi:MAG: hypothetical protein WCX22_08400, partial [Methanoregula sp.]